MHRATAIAGIYLAILIAALTLQPGPALAAKNKDAVAVIIGNKDYTSSIPTVEFAHRDADAFKVFVTDVLGYLPDNIIDLRDATKAQLETAFGNRVTHEGKLWRYLHPKGKSDVMVFYSGHGVPGLRDRKGYLLPVDADPDTPEINGYPLDTLIANLAKLEARSVTVFLDACFSGDSPKGMLVNATSGIVIKPRMPGQTASRMNIVTAAQGDQVASWDLKARHGLFTKHLLEALYGGADTEDYGNGDGKVVLSEVKAYLDDRMTRAARRQFGRHQNAWVKGRGDTVLVAAIPKTPSPTLMTAEETRQRQARIKLAQQALRDLGLYRGGMDGVLGPMTQAALSGWLTGNGYAKDAELDDDLVGKLGQAAQRHVKAAREAEARRQAQEQARLAKLADERRRRTEAAERARLARLEVERQRRAEAQEQARLAKLEAERKKRAEQERKAEDARKARLAARRKPGDTFKDCDDCPEMVVIPSGRFRMGDLQGGGQGDEKPVHDVRIDYGFAVGKFEVTQAQWRAVMGNNPSYYKGDSRPVEQVSWDDAKAFIRRFNAKTGQRYRLLSEAEWEYVARAGTETRYSWGNGFNSAKANKKGSTKPVGSYAPNAFGLYDMHGNVWEWVEDCWNGDYTGAPRDGSAWTGGDCSRRVLRGGSWYYVPRNLRAADRFRYGTGNRFNSIGFRVARTLSR